jgi:two-component system cell cycle response regulator CpdR
MPMARVLLVEDFDLLNSFLCEAIAQAGHDVHCDCVRTKAEAEKLLKTQSYDLLISDVLLPDGSGHELAALATDLGIKTVLMNGHPTEVRALRVSGARYLIKPFRQDDLARMLTEMLPSAR